MNNATTSAAQQSVFNARPASAPQPSRLNQHRQALCIMPDGTIGTREGFLNWDRQQTVAEKMR